MRAQVSGTVEIIADDPDAPPLSEAMLQTFAGVTDYDLEKAFLDPALLELWDGNSASHVTLSVDRGTLRMANELPIKRALTDDEMLALHESVGRFWRRLTGH